MPTTKSSIAHRITALTALLLVGVTATAVAAGPASASSSRPSNHRAYRISVVQTGGIAGVNETYSVDRSTPNSAPILARASSPEYLALNASYAPANPCCDRFTYQVTVNYTGNPSKTVTMTEGSNCPDIMYEIIEGVEYLNG
ncbi:hypothetical protein Lfu02_73660 [Longispora fulva]|uniref:Uncharacterized protein n=1 Tax=Longispora fulva TaxID=619741 RepID=A0A8J7GI70_9ACTN|nr:hypothetical protein [Longispora fulva]MBG6134279.1 hypothetical protein [Longispora fulva]GIG62994.1 hypothetical protein Lfu02_73660 [Longispora fulva]